MRPALSNKWHPCHARQVTSGMTDRNDRFGVFSPSWRRGGDHTQRGVTRQMPLWNPRGAHSAKTESRILAVIDT